MSAPMPHAPVMLRQMLEVVAPRDQGIYIDGTFGAGGYSRALLSAARCRVFAIDRDPGVRVFAQALELQFPERFVWLLGRFSQMCELVGRHGVAHADGIVLDLGVSSMQIDQAGRGFSFREDAPLDMRMSQEGVSAADLVNQASEAELADILYYYGEEKASRRIARSIAEMRAEAPIATTKQLAQAVYRALGRSAGKTDPATKSFQALRIKVNDELGELERGLAAAEALLAPGGRLVAVTFHSLEDRIVKQFLRSRCGKTGGVPRHLPDLTKNGACGGEAPRFFLPKLHKRMPDRAEIAANPRSRSATLRSMTRAGAA